ncbi:MAG: TonB-dependent receptor [Burkholderiaceae bacterium]
MPHPSRKHPPSRKTTSRAVADGASASRRLLPLGALAAGFGLMQAQALAQVPAAPAASASAPAASAAAPAATPSGASRETTLPAIAVTAKPETDANSLRALTTTVGRGNQEQRDIPQSVTVVTDRLMQDRQVDTLNEALHLMGGISFLAAEGGEQDIRLRGFSISGDIYVDTIHDPAFYDRDMFNFERIELLRGSASMLFGRGSTGGVVNQVSKQAFLDTANIVNFTAGNDGFLRFTGDFNVQTGETSAVRFNLMRNTADNHGNFIDKEGAAVNFRWGIGTPDELYASIFYLNNDNGMNYGLPWLRRNSTQASANPSVMIPGLNPNNLYYGAPSDYNAGGATYGTLGWLHRFDDGGEMRAQMRYGVYDRDQRASTIRFCTNNNANANPDCPRTPPGLDTISDATILTRGTNNKVQDMTTTYLQVDYTNRFDWFGVNNEVLAGVDLAHEEFSGYAMVLPPGVVLNKNSPRTTLGTPDNGYGWVDESLRIQRQQAAFDARAAGIFAQDLIQVAEYWKVLVGLRYDYFRGDYQSFQTASNGNVPVGTVTADRKRSEGLWSERFGVLYQPTPTTSYYFSYGTSFNTSGDTYQYDLPGSNTPPEASRNIELGTYFTLFDGRLSARASVFNITKTNERNRDSPAGTPIEDYLLSGRRHATGIDLDVAGRITPLWDVFVSYAWIPIAEIDQGNADGTTLTGELVGQRPSLTPRNSGSLWTTYQVLPQLRLGGGITFRSSQTPNRNPPGIVAPSFVTGDLMAQYDFSDAVTFMLNVTNVTNHYYADSLYSGHYVPGAPRSVQGTLTLRF